MLVTGPEVGLKRGRDLCLEHCSERVQRKVSDVIVALGPGDTLGGPIGQTLVAEGWAGIRDREAFRERQISAQPILLSLGRSVDRQRLSA